MQAQGTYEICKVYLEQASKEDSMHQFKIKLQNHHLSVLQQPKIPSKLWASLKQVIEKKTKRVILMLQRPMVNAHTK